MRHLTIEAEPAFRTRRANPYNAALYERVRDLGPSVRDLSWRRLLTRRVDIVHLHWPSLTFLSGDRRVVVIARLLLFSTCLAIARLRGTRLVWTAHNTGSHERRSTERLRRWHRRMLMRGLDGVIVMTQSGAEEVRRGYPELAEVPLTVVPHGHYRGDYDFSRSRRESREHLGVALDAVVLVTVGQIRPYKGVPQLITTFRSVASQDALLLVAGKPSDVELRQAIEATIGDDPRVRFEPGFLDDDALALRLAAADLVVLNYSAVQNSGSAVLALSAGRPVLAPAIGALPELRDAVGDEWVRLFTGSLSPEVLRHELVRSRTPPGAGPDLDAFEWDRIAQQTIAFYERVRASPRIAASARPASPAGAGAEL